jgi:hypothetical protein
MDDIKTKVKDLAEEEAAAVDEKREADKKKAADDAAEAAKNRNTFTMMADIFKNNFSDLKDSMKDDFQVLTAAYSTMGQTPFVRTIISLLKFIGLWIFQLAFEMIGKKFFPNLLAQGKDNTTDMKESFKNIGKFFKGKLGFGPKISRFKGDEETPAGAGAEKGGGGLFAGIGQGVRDLATKTKKSFTDFAGSVQGWLTEQQEQSEAFQKMKQNISEKFEEYKTAVSEKVKAVGNSMKVWAKGLWKSALDFIKNTSVYKVFAKAGKAVAASFMSMARAMWKHVKKAAVAIGSFIIASIAWIVSMFMSAAALIAPAIPYILIGIAIALLVAGLIWLGMKIYENWEQIKERFAIAMDQLSIWASKAALWLSTALAPIRDKLGMFFAVILDGIASMLNGAIEWINSMQPGWLRKITGGDIITWRMEEGHVDTATAEAALRESERSAAGAEIEEREADLADRRAAYDAEYKGGAAAVQQNNVVNNNNTRQVNTPSTRPFDRTASAFATAQ